MTIYKEGDVVLVPFPFTDLTTAKRRPAVVVSANWFNSSKLDCVLVGITSQLPITLEQDELLLTAADLASAGLPLPSMVKTGKIVTIQQNLIVKSIGTLPNDTLKQVITSISEQVLKI